MRAIFNLNGVIKELDIPKLIPTYKFVVNKPVTASAYIGDLRKTPNHVTIETIEFELVERQGDVGFYFPKSTFMKCPYSNC